jgi:AcrR family transcriptional regulator
VASGSRTRNRVTKAEQAEATRRRIVEAATTLFLRDGFVTTTMAAVAKQAGVAVQTLYLSYGSKTAILQAAFDHALRGPGATTDVVESEWVQQVLDEPDGPSALRLFCERSSDVIGRAAPLFDVIRAAAADPEVGDLLSYNKRLRYEGFRLVADALTDREGFDPSLSASDALGILYGVLSEDTYLLMVEEHGWTRERWTAWAFESTRAQLFPVRLTR